MLYVSGLQKHTEIKKNCLDADLRFGFRGWSMVVGGNLSDQDRF